MKITTRAGSVTCETDDGWRYEGVRTTKKPPHRWAADRTSPEGQVEKLKFFEDSVSIIALARQHLPKQKGLF